MTTQSASLPTPTESPEAQPSPPTQADRPGLPSAFGQPLPGCDCGPDDASDLHEAGRRMVDDLQAFLASALSTPKTKPV